MHGLEEGLRLGGEERRHLQAGPAIAIVDLFDCDGKAVEKATVDGPEGAAKSISICAGEQIHDAGIINLQPRADFGVCVRVHPRLISFLISTLLRGIGDCRAKSIKCFNSSICGGVNLWHIKIRSHELRRLN